MKLLYRGFRPGTEFPHQAGNFRLAASADASAGNPSAGNPSGAARSSSQRPVFSKGEGPSGEEGVAEARFFPGGTMFLCQAPADGPPGPGTAVFGASRFLEGDIVPCGEQGAAEVLSGRTMRLRRDGGRRRPSGERPAFGAFRQRRACCGMFPLMVRKGAPGPVVVHKLVGRAYPGKASSARGKKGVCRTPARNVAPAGWFSARSFHAESRSSERWSSSGFASVGKGRFSIACPTGRKGRTPAGRRLAYPGQLPERFLPPGCFSAGRGENREAVAGADF